MSYLVSIEEGTTNLNLSHLFLLVQLFLELRVHGERLLSSEMSDVAFRTAPPSGGLFRLSNQKSQLILLMVAVSSSMSDWYASL